MYILGKKFCNTPDDFGQISAEAGGLNFGQGRGPGRSLPPVQLPWRHDMPLWLHSSYVLLNLVLRVYESTKQIICIL